MQPIELEAQIACVEREIRRRHAYYPRLVKAEQVSAEQARREIAQMNAVLATLRGLRFKEHQNLPNRKR